MDLSEKLAAVSLVAWERARGLRAELPPWTARVEPSLLESPLVKRILGRLDKFADQWHALPVGGAITVAWRPRRRAVPQ